MKTEPTDRGPIPSLDFGSSTLPHSAFARLRSAFGIRHSALSHALSLFLSAVSASAAPLRAETDPDRLVLEHLRFRKVSKHDPGTIHLWVRNVTDSPVSLRRVLADGFVIPTISGTTEYDPDTAWQDIEGDGDEATRFLQYFAGKRFLWGRFEPTAVDPGSLGHLIIKLTHLTQQPIRLQLETDETDVFETDVSPLSVDDPVLVTAVTITADLRRVYVYLTGNGIEPFDVHELRIEGAECQSNAWLSSATIAKGEKQLAVIDLDKPVVRGSFLTVVVRGKEANGTIERVRVITGFPIGTDESQLPMWPEVGLDPHPYEIRLGHHHTPLEPPAGVGHDRGFYMYWCPMHKYDRDRHRCSAEIMALYQQCYDRSPAAPCSVHPCRVELHVAYPWFAETADILRINPNVYSLWLGNHKGDPPERAVARVLSVACPAARPRPIHMVADTSKTYRREDTADMCDFRRRMLTVLGHAPKALFYRRNFKKEPEERRDDVNDAIRRLNAEVRQLASLLSVADTVPWATTDTPSATAYALLAGDSAVILAVVNHSRNQTDSPGETDITLRLPDWLIPGNAFRIDHADKLPLQATPTDGGVSFRCRLPETGEIILLETMRRAP